MPIDQGIIKLQSYNQILSKRRSYQLHCCWCNDWQYAVHSSHNWSRIVSSVKPANVIESHIQQVRFHAFLVSGTLERIIVKDSTEDKIQRLPRENQTVHWPMEVKVLLVIMSLPQTVLVVEDLRAAFRLTKAIWKVIWMTYIKINDGYGEQSGDLSRSLFYHHFRFHLRFSVKFKGTIVEK